jgi:endo-1,4-beta-xylanase
MKQIIASAAIFAASVSAIQVWGQCGGQGWTGSGSCDSGTTCVKQNDCKSHCRPIADIIH